MTAFVADIWFGWFFVAAALLALGPLTMWFARRDLREEQRATHPSFGNRPDQQPFRADVEADVQQSLAVGAHFRSAEELIERANARAATYRAFGEATGAARDGFERVVVPLQRDRRGGGQ